MRSTQGGIILGLLRAAAGDWVSALELHEASGSLAVHTRVSDLRKLGHQIENRTRHEGARCLSEYRLIKEATGPPTLETHFRPLCNSGR